MPAETWRRVLAGMREKVTQRSPDQFERLMTAAKYPLAETPAVPRIVFLSSWNEGTRYHALVPATVYGYSHLEAVRCVFAGSA